MTVLEFIELRQRFAQLLEARAEGSAISCPIDIA